MIQIFIEKMYETDEFPGMFVNIGNDLEWLPEEIKEGDTDGFVYHIDLEHPESGELLPNDSVTIRRVTEGDFELNIDLSIRNREEG